MAAARQCCEYIPAFAFEVTQKYENLDLRALYTKVYSTRSSVHDGNMGRTKRRTSRLQSIYESCRVHIHVEKNLSPVVIDGVFHKSQAILEVLTVESLWFGQISRSQFF